MIRITIEAGDGATTRKVVVSDDSLSEHSSADEYVQLMSQALKGFGFAEQTVDEYIPPS